MQGQAVDLPSEMKFVRRSQYVVGSECFPALKKTFEQSYLFSPDSE